MITFDELSTKSKSQIRNSNVLSEAFEFYFFEKFNQKPSFCCTFSDYNKLFNNFNLKKMATAKNYKIDYPATFVLAYRKNNKTFRTLAKNATDEFLKEFLENYAEAHFPNADKRIVLIEKKKPKKKEVKTPVNEDSE